MWEYLFFYVLTVKDKLFFKQNIIYNMWKHFCFKLRNIAERN